MPRCRQSPVAGTTHTHRMHWQERPYKHAAVMESANSSPHHPGQDLWKEKPFKIKNRSLCWPLARLRLACLACLHPRNNIVKQNSCMQPPNRDSHRNCWQSYALYWLRIVKHHKALCNYKHATSSLFPAVPCQLNCFGFVWPAVWYGMVRIH